MGSECRQSKLHYDIGMSKRTRRPSDFNFKRTEAECDPAKEDQGIGEVGNQADENDNKQSVVIIRSSNGGGFDEEEIDNKKSLKQFIQGRSLYQHFSEEEEEIEKEKENQLKLVKQKDIQQSFKFKKLVSRYGKVLGQLIKLKRNPDTFPKKPIPIPSKFNATK